MSNESLRLNEDVERQCRDGKKIFVMMIICVSLSEQTIIT